MPTAVVLAGGLGTRVAHLTGQATPKALLPIDGHPFIDFKLLELASMGFTHVHVLTGHAAPALRDHIGDGQVYGLVVACHEDGPELLGTGGAIRRVLPSLPRRFWVTYGDSLVVADVERAEDMLTDELLGVMTVLENNDRWDPSNVEVADGLVVRYEKGAPPGSMRWIDYGLIAFDRDAFAEHQDPVFDLGEVIRSLVTTRRMGAFVVVERFHDIGTEDAWRETDAWARSTGLWTQLSRPAPHDR